MITVDSITNKTPRHKSEGSNIICVEKVPNVDDYTFLKNIKND